MGQSAQKRSSSAGGVQSRQIGRRGRLERRAALELLEPAAPATVIAAEKALWPEALSDSLVGVARMRAVHVQAPALFARLSTQYLHVSHREGRRCGRRRD